MSQNSYTTDELGYSKTLVKNSLFTPLSELYSALPTQITNVITGGVSPSVVRSGDMTGNFNIVTGYLKSYNFASGVNGWKFDNVGNLEANSATIRGSIYAEAGLIGGWVIDNDGLYYNGSGNPQIKTSTFVGAGADGVIIDKDGIRGYESVLGNVFNLPSDGSPPFFSSGIITETNFEISTNSVIRTSETVGDGGPNSAGVLINNTGIFACENNQLFEDANVRITRDGSGYFKGTVNASYIVSSNIYGTNIYGAMITGGEIRTAEDGQRTEINSEGIILYNGETGATYGDDNYPYGDSDRKYGTGVLAYINSSIRAVPFYVQSEQAVGDFHLVNRINDPGGVAEIGDLAVVAGKLKICTVAGEPGTWQVVGDQTA
jgi:hypothetical protein